MATIPDSPTAAEEYLHRRAAEIWREDVAKAQEIEDPLERHDALSGLMLQRAEEIISSSRRIREQKSALKAIAHFCGFKPDNAFIADLYDQLDGTLSSHEPDVEPGGRFAAPAQSWLLEGIFLNGLNLLVGMPGAGKSRLLVALIRAHLTDQATFIGRQLQPGSSRQILLIGTDQDRQQWGALLAEQGLAKVLGGHPDGGIEYQLHGSIHLKTSGGGFRLDPDGMRYIRDWCRANPAGLLVIDSLSAVLPPGIKEADENAGRLVRQIEVARQGNPCLMTHHSNKQSAWTGELGVYSGSGHGSIDRAVSRFIGLGYETHKQNGVDVPHQDSPRRILTSQKRGAANQRLVLENGDQNTWDYIGTAAEIREAQREEIDESPEQRFKGWKLAAWKALSTEWRTTSAVYEQLADDLQRKPNGRKVLGEKLRDLREEEQIQHRSGGYQTEAEWRLKPSSFL
jgi:hypothetical protein